MGDRKADQRERLLMAQTTEVSTILWDMDGTLVDSVPLIVESFRYTVREHTGLTLPDEVFVAGIGMPLSEQLKTFSRDTAECDSMREMYSRYYVQNALRVSPFDGVEALLGRLKAEGFRQGIVTSKSRAGLDRVLKQFSWEGLFDVTVGADEVTRGKPNPEPVLLALEQLGVTASDAWMIGDSPHDLEAGKAAGTRIGAVSWGPFEHSLLHKQQPDAFFESLDSIVSLFIG